MVEEEEEEKEAEEVAEEAEEAAEEAEEAGLLCLCNGSCTLQVELRP